MKSEAQFRHGDVDNFINTLENSIAFSIQQMAIRGDADIILCVRGMFVWLELKREKGKVDKLQKYKASLVRRASGIAIVAKPSNWDSIKYFLSELDKGIFDKQALLRINKEE